MPDAAPVRYHQSDAYFRTRRAAFSALGAREWSRREAAWLAQHWQPLRPLGPQLSQMHRAIVSLWELQDA